MIHTVHTHQQHRPLTTTTESYKKNRCDDQEEEEQQQQRTGRNKITKNIYIYIYIRNDSETFETLIDDCRYRIPGERKEEELEIGSQDKSQQHIHCCVRVCLVVRKQSYRREREN